MPHRVLQIVAGLIALAAISSLVMGILNAPQRGGRLPGAKVSAADGPATVIEAPDATPLNNERIEGPPPPTPEELAQAKADAEAKAAAADAAAAAEEAADQAAAGNAPAPPVVRPPAPTGDTGQQTLGGPPAADEPPH